MAAIDGEEEAERDALLRWVIGALPAGSLVLPEPAADFDVSRLDVQQLLAQLRDATIMGARVDLSGPQMLRSVSVPVGRAKKRGNRAKRLARYESVLLCAFLGTELRGDAAERRLDELQQAFGVEDGVHETMWHHLRLSDEATATDIVEQGASPSDVHYRFELLREARPHEFGSREAFVEWVQRQVSVYHRGFAAALGWAAAERREEMAGFGEMVKAMFKNVIDVAASDEEVFPEEGYSDALAACASTTASAYMMLDDAVDPRFHSELSDRPRAYLSYVYPMNTEMYETVLEACLGDQDGSGQSWQRPGVADLLLHLQNELRVSECMDQLARAHVLLLRCARLSELEQRVRGTSRPARREQEVLAEVQQICTLLGAAGGRSAVTGWAEEEQRAYTEKVRLDVGRFCRDVLEDYHVYIESGASEIWECLAKLLAMCDQPHAQPESDASSSGVDGGGGMAPPPVIVRDSANLDDAAAVPEHQQDSEVAASGADQTALALVAAQCITAGVQRLYMNSEHIAAAGFDSDPSFGELGAIAEAVAGQLADEAEHSAPFFANVHPTALCSIAKALAESVRAHYRKCCIAEEDNARRYARLVNAASPSEGTGVETEDGTPQLLQGATTDGSDQSTWLTLTPEVVHCMQCLSALDEQLLSCGLQEADTMLGYRVSEVAQTEALEDNRFPGLVETWLDEKRQQFDHFILRCIELEEQSHWTPVLESESVSGSDRDNQGAAVIYESSSVLDLFALLSQAVDSFLEMELPPWETAFLSLLEHVVGAAIAYANRLHESCLRLVQQAAPPPRPRLKRPSRDERPGAARGGVAVLAAGALRLASAGGIALPRSSPDALEDTAVENLQSVVTRLNNVDYGARQFKTLWSRVAQKWSAAASRSDRAGDDVAPSSNGTSPEFFGMTPHGSRRLDAMLGGMENSYRTTADELAAAVARMITYGERSPVRGAMLDTLYMHGETLGESDRVDAVLCALIEETVVGEDSVLTKCLSPALLPQLTKEVRLSALSCFERILLDGGAGRIFAPSDSPLLKEDYLSLLATFAQLQAEAEEIAMDSETGSGSNINPGRSHGGGNGRGSNREDDLRRVLGRVGLDACVCSRRVECHRATDHGSSSAQSLATPATVFCADCGCALFCAACSAALHVGGYADHTPWTFGEQREQARAHAVLELMGMPSAALVSQLHHEKSQRGAASGSAQVGTYGKHQPNHQQQIVYPADIARVLAHRDDADALAYMRQTVPNYDTCGGPWDPMTLGSATAAPPTDLPPLGLAAAPATPVSAGGAEQDQQGERGSAGSVLSWSPGSVGSLLGDVGRAMRR